jgi:prepilin-type N-terminal cleavage/methylation domain-containing protein
MTMPRRSGVTLLEVLVAIFVMGIGMLALLTLFPLGALRMAKALQDQRCSEAGASAKCVWTMKNILNDSGLTAAPGDGFINPLNPQVAANNALAEGPSYPILIDPTGYLTSTGTIFQLNLGGSSWIARRNVSFAAGNQAAFRWFTLLDDIDFESLATGLTLPGSPRALVPPAPLPVFVRDIRYSYAYLCQRPRQADTSVVDTSVVVYNKRPLSGVGNLSLAEYPYPTSTFDPTANTITINYAGLTPPPLRAGDWVLDASPVSSGGNVVSAHGYFYRVVEATDLGGSVLQVEVETPLRGFTAATVGTAIVLDGVAEVFTIGTARLP